VGSGQVAGAAFSVLPRSIDFWETRLLQHGVSFGGSSTRGEGADRERVIAFRDPDGLLVELVGHAAAEARAPWGAAGVPEEHALRGFHGVTLWVDAADPTERALRDTLGFRAVHEHEGTRRYAVGDGAPGCIVDVRAVGNAARGAGGAGTVHHVAFAVADDRTELVAREHVARAGLRPTPVIDRTYFHSVYFREPGGVLFELATNAPALPLTSQSSSLASGSCSPRSTSHGAPRLPRRSRRCACPSARPPSRPPGRLRVRSSTPRK
jgi:glyoxalase family protein